MFHFCKKIRSQKERSCFNSISSSLDLVAENQRLSIILYHIPSASQASTSSSYHLFVIFFFKKIWPLISLRSPKLELIINTKIQIYFFYRYWLLDMSAIRQCQQLYNIFFFRFKESMIFVDLLLMSISIVENIKVQKTNLTICYTFTNKIKYRRHNYNNTGRLFLKYSQLSRINVYCLNNLRKQIPFIENKWF